MDKKLTEHTFKYDDLNCGRFAIIKKWYYTSKYFFYNLWQIIRKNDTRIYYIPTPPPRDLHSGFTVEFFNPMTNQKEKRLFTPTRAEDVLPDMTFYEGMYDPAKIVDYSITHTEDSCTIDVTIQVD